MPIFATSYNVLFDKLTWIIVARRLELISVSIPLRVPREIGLLESFCDEDRTFLFSSCTLR